MFDLTSFIEKYVICREKSLFIDDISDHSDVLCERIKGKSILVIGGAGSIGSSFIRAVLLFEPSELVVVDTNENMLTELTRSLRSSEELSEHIPDIYITYPMDYSSAVFQRMFSRHQRMNGSSGFDIVANFSAHKHVRSEKDIYSVEALLQNNIIHAKELMELLTEFPPDIYFCVSTDKAANPVNIMGASKRIMEDMIFSYSSCFPVKTARFANVAFSNGSLPDGFLKRISLNQPLSAPNDVKRYFVSPEESGQICMLAAILGENREIFFPKLEEASMTTFDAIARDLLIAKGYEPIECESEKEAIRQASELNKLEKNPDLIKSGTKLGYPVYFSRSNTSGEKPFEEFVVDGEMVDMNRFKALGVITGKPTKDRSSIDELVNELSDAFNMSRCTKEDIVRIIADYLPSFKHIETGKSLDEKM